METTTTDEWVVDMATMTCWNKSNDIIVVFEKYEKVLVGKIKSIPLELVNKWAKEKQGDINIKNTIKEAEDSFLKAYIGW